MPPPQAVAQGPNGLSHGGSGGGAHAALAPPPPPDEARREREKRKQRAAEKREQFHRNPAGGAPKVARRGGGPSAGPHAIPQAATPHPATPIPQPPPAAAARQPLARLPSGNVGAGLEAATPPDPGCPGPATASVRVDDCAREGIPPAPMVRFGSVEFSDAEKERVAIALKRQIPADKISKRPGRGVGGGVHYIEHATAVNEANHIFGFSGWSSEVVKLNREFFVSKDNRTSVGYSCILRVSLPNGQSHTDVGFGCSMNQPSPGDAISNAQKSAVSDARKRALRVYGEALGGSVYDKSYLEQVDQEARRSAGF